MAKQRGIMCLYLSKPFIVYYSEPLFSSITNSQKEKFYTAKGLQNIHFCIKRMLKLNV